MKCHVDLVPEPWQAHPCNTEDGAANLLMSATGRLEFDAEDGVEDSLHFWICLRSPKETFPFVAMYVVEQTTNDYIGQLAIKPSQEDMEMEYKKPDYDEMLVKWMELCVDELGKQLCQNGRLKEQLESLRVPWANIKGTLH